MLSADLARSQDMLKVAHQDGLTHSDSKSSKIIQKLLSTIGENSAHDTNILNPDVKKHDKTLKLKL